jgi:L-idonate 5-dehydrogenase
LHYYFEGAVGAFKVRQPFVIGHEMSGTVAAVGDGVTSVQAGDRVAVNPTLACGHCDYCRSGRENLCRSVRFFGTASTMPHTDGAYQEFVLVAERQAHRLPADFDLTVAATAEPLAVCLHAVNRAGAVMGKSVLITGAGTIGSMTLLAARAMGATNVTITDVLDERLERARACGADMTINVATDSPEAQGLAASEMEFDLVFEASGNVRALHSGIANTVKGGTIVHVGFLPGAETPIPANLLMTREITFTGTFRFAMEFDWAVEYLVQNRIDTRPLITHTFPFEQSNEAFATAADGTQSTKVQLFFSPE